MHENELSLQVREALSGMNDPMEAGKQKMAFMKATVRPLLKILPLSFSLFLSLSLSLSLSFSLLLSLSLFLPAF